MILLDIDNLTKIVFILKGIFSTYSERKIIDYQNKKKKKNLLYCQIFSNKNIHFTGCRETNNGFQAPLQHLKQFIIFTDPCHWRKQ